MKPQKNPVIETKRLVLRLLDKSDLPALFAVNGDAKVFRYSPRAHWRTSSDGKAWYNRVMGLRRSGATMQFVIVLRETGRAIGTLAVFHFDEEVLSAEIGYVLGRAHWNKGFATELLRAFVGFAFGPLGLKRIEAELDPRNAASITVLERAGFVREGLKRRNYFCKGEVTDTGYYGMLSTDPRTKPGRRHAATK